MARMIGAYGFEKRVALKSLKPAVASEADHVRMFVREALVAAGFAPEPRAGVRGRRRLRAALHRDGARARGLARVPHAFAR